MDGPDVKIGDLGLARNVESKDNNVYSFVGTFNYLSPELINNLGYLFKSDIWYMQCKFLKCVNNISNFKKNLFKHVYFLFFLKGCRVCFVRNDYFEESFCGWCFRNLQGYQWGDFTRVQNLTDLGVLSKDVCIVYTINLL